MAYTRQLLVAIAVVAVVGMAVGTVFAAGKPNLVVVGSDFESGSVRRGSRIFARASAALSDQLHEAGFDVYDALDLSPHLVRATGGDREILNAARAANRPPLDIVVIFAAYTKARQNDYGTWVGARVAGRMLNVRTGQILSTFELASPRLRRAPVDCARPCLAEMIGREAQILARDMGAALAEKLVWASAPTPRSTPAPEMPKPAAVGASGYALMFDGFTPEDVTAIEEYLVVFRDYARHRPVRAGARHHEFWYETGSGSGRLYRNLKKMLGHMGLRGRVDFAGNVFTVTRIAQRADRSFGPGDW